jgi:hypothetical protein
MQREDIAELEGVGGGYNLARSASEITPGKSAVFWTVHYPGPVRK